MDSTILVLLFRDDLSIDWWYFAAFWLIAYDISIVVNMCKPALSTLRRILFISQFSFPLHVFALCDFDSHPRIPILIRARPDFISFNLVFECVVNIIYVWYFLHMAYSWAFLQWDSSLALTLIHHIVCCLGPI